MLVLDLHFDINILLLSQTSLKLHDPSFLVFLRAQELLDLSQVGVDSEILPGQLLNDLILILNVFTEAIVLLFDSCLLFK